MRLSDATCLRLIRRGLADVLVPELESDAARDAGRILLRTVDELLMRHSDAKDALNDLLQAGITLALRLEAMAQGMRIAVEESSTHLQTLAQKLSARDPAVDITMLRRELLGVVDQLLNAILSGSEVANAAALQVAQDAADWENALEQAVVAAAETRPPGVIAAGGLTRVSLQDWLCRALSEPQLEVDEFERITGGMSKRTYRFRVRSNAWGNQPLILREMAGPPHGDFDSWILGSEYRLMRSLFQLGFPVPEPLLLSEDGRAYVMHRAPGGANAGIFSVSARIPQTVLLGMAEFLGRLHSTPLHQFEDFLRLTHNEQTLTETTSQCVRRTLLRWRDYSRRMRRLPSPIEAAEFQWLLQNVPPVDAPPSLLHGDIGPQNCLWDSERLTAVLDWEAAHCNDPAFDLGYLKPNIVARMDWNEFLRHYEAHGGPRIDQRRMQYFERFSMYRTLLTTNQVVARAEHGDITDLVALQVDFQYWPNFIKQTVTAR
ncbi:MAG: phosphotransferase family protein [Steroidobacteraceae bacterium]